MNFNKENKNENKNENINENKNENENENETRIINILDLKNLKDQNVLIKNY